MTKALIWIAPAICLIGSCCFAFAQNNGLDFAEPSSDMLLKYYSTLSKRYTNKWSAKTEAIKTPEDWQLMRKNLLSAHLNGIGPFPKRTPLNAHITGQIELSEVKIEKIIFESRPGYYVTSNLYLPSRTTQKPFPAVLIVIGHWHDSKADPDHNLLALTLARNGVAAFVIDTIGQGERVPFIDSVGKPLYNDTTEHSIMTFPCWLTGNSSIQYFLWDAIRAVDYLETRPEIDKKCIGLTGASGGGTQVSYLMPIEQRIKLAAPTVSISKSAKWLSLDKAEDGEQSVYGSIRGGIIHTSLIEMAAPRPYQVQSATQDFNPIEGARQCVSEAEKIYKLLGVPNKMQMVQYEGGHAYSPELRSYFYKWVNKWFLKDKPVIPEIPTKPNTIEELNCTSTGQVKTSYKDAKWISDLNYDRANAIAPNRKIPDSKKSLENYKKAVRLAMNKVLQISVPKQLPALSKDIKKSETVISEIQWLQTETGITVPCNISKPLEGENLPAVLLINDKGANSEEVTALQELITSKGFLVMSADVRGVGSSAPGELQDPVDNPSQFYVYANVMSQVALKCGTTIFQGRLLDAIQCINYLSKCKDVNSKKIAVIGWGECGVLALTLAANDVRVSACANIGGFADYKSLTSVEIPQYPASAYLWNVLSYYDLPEAAACISPRPLLLSGLLGPTRKLLEQDSVSNTYKQALEAYGIDGANDALQISARKVDIIEWLRGL